ncbi:nucleolin-like [Cynara cardunculus var. scolymus]|uniref:nucleolin-like n=1 Tax=Cynara cardunculus var. scolymus TaxID=59895 RepID=UPI000D624A18|nr:nucleolin-like [Cynara cardunculus var. scolymus]
MADDVKLIFLTIETLLIKKDQVHKGMPLRVDVSSDLSAVKADVNDVKEHLSTVQAIVHTNAEAISALNSKANEANAQLPGMEGEKDLDVVVAIVPRTEVEADAQRAEANEDEVIDDTITTNEANEAEVVDDTIRVDAEAYDEDLPITPTADVGDEEDEGEDDDDEDDSPSLPGARKDLAGDDDEDDDDDDFTIQYHKLASALKGVFLRDS